MRLFCLQSGFQSGAYNMALDEALLEWVRNQERSILIVRTYQWERPTLSLGVNQPAKDVQALLRLYGVSSSTNCIIRRPTGGRAILHGADVSFSFVTNDPAMLRKSLNDSYELLSGFIQETVQALGIQTRQSAEAQDKDYLRSPVCFQTHTPSDLLAENGQKICGSAQLRRLGGLLQHGAAFLQPYDITEEAFSAQLFKTIENALQSGFQPFLINQVSESLQKLEADYLKESGEILASASATNGSHLLPASC